MIIIGFSLTVFVHELGHFLLARWAGAHVETFCIGMGPRVVKLYTDKLGTEYIIALFPIGGYVKILGQEDMPKKKAKKPKYPKGHYLSISPYKRLAIVVAGVIMNVIFAYCLIVAAFCIGIPFGNNQVGDIIEENSAFDTSELRLLDEIIAINGQPINTWEEMQTKVVLMKNNQVIALKVKRDGDTLIVNATNIQTKNDKKKLSFLGIMPYQPAVVYSDGKTLYNQDNQAIKNQTPILKASLDDGNIIKETPFGIYQLLASHPNQEVDLLLQEEDGKQIWYSNVSIAAKKVFDKGYLLRAVIDVLPGKAAAQAGLIDGDEIIAINDTAIRGWQNLSDFFLASHELSTDLQIKVKRDNQELSFSIKPGYNALQERYMLGVMPSQKYRERSREVSYVSEELKQLDTSLQVGDEILSYVKRKNTHYFRVKRGDEMKQVALSQLVFPLAERGDICRLKKSDKIISYALPVAFIKAGPQILRELQEVYLSLNRLITGNIPLQMLGGPVRIFEISYTIATEKGLAYFILLFAKLGISLAILNILPIPVLDGGHVVFLLYEIIFSRPVNEKVAYVTHMIGFILLLSLFAFVFYNDIRSIIMR